MGICKTYASVVRVPDLVHDAVEAPANGISITIIRPVWCPIAYNSKAKPAPKTAARKA